jgi:hypothetical protein
MIHLLDNVMSPEIGQSAGPPSFPPGMRGPAPPPSPPSGPVAKRAGTLENKTVYLVDTGFGGSYQFMKQLQKWFAVNMPSVTTVRKRKPGNVFMDDNNELWEEIKARGHAAVVGVAG